MTEELKTVSEVNNILDAKPENGKSIKEMSSFEFCQFCLRRLNNIRVDNYEVINLTKFVNSYNPEFQMSDQTKIDTIMRLRKLGVYNG